MNALLRIASLGAASVLLLSGCQTKLEKAMCPTANILASTSALTAFKANMPGDPAGALYTVQITGVEASCSFDQNEGTTDSDLDITFRATRAPSGDAADYTAPYYVLTVLTGTTIVNKQILATAFTFRPGEATTTFTQNVPSVVIKFDNGKKPYEYGLLVGLQLTREQLDYSKKTGRFGP